MLQFCIWNTKFCTWRIVPLHKKWFGVVNVNSSFIFLHPEFIFHFGHIIPLSCPQFQVKLQQELLLYTRVILYPDFDLSLNS